MGTEVVATLLGTILGLIGGFIISYWGSINLSRRQAVSQVSMKLIYAFKDELAILSNPNGEEISQGDIIKNAFNKHLSAYIEFRTYLSSKEKIKLDKAWHDYYCQDGDPNQPFIEQYSEHIGDIRLAKKNKDLAISRIEELLSIAKTKL